MNTEAAVIDPAATTSEVPSETVPAASENPSEVVVKEPVTDPAVDPALIQSLTTFPGSETTDLTIPYEAPPATGMIQYVRDFAGDPPPGYEGLEYVGGLLVFLLLFRFICDLFRGITNMLFNK